MQGAAIAAALKGRKKRNNDRDVFMTEMLDDFFESEGSSNAADRSKKMESITMGKLSGSTVAFDKHVTKVAKHEKQIDGLIAKVDDRMARSGNYNSFVSIMCFFVLYLAAVMMQQDTPSASAVQSSFQATIIAGLPAGAISGPDDLFDWLQADIVDRGWDEPVCGDGTCEWDSNEFPGFGRFGCIEDCGRYLFTSKITVDLQVLFDAAAKVLDWNLKKVDPLRQYAAQGRTPGYRWNIYSYTMGAFLLETDANPQDGARVLEVPDGELELYLYQYTKMSELLDITDITLNRAFGPKIRQDTVPERAPGLTDYAYGDKREALASQSELVTQLFSYCYEGPVDMFSPLFDWRCWKPFDEHFLNMFGGYGMNGTIKMGNGTRDTANLVQVPFCGVVPGGLKGLGNGTSREKRAVQAASVPCQAGRRRQQAVVSAAAEAADKEGGRDDSWRLALEAEIDAGDPTRAALRKQAHEQRRLLQEQRRLLREGKGETRGHADGSQRSLLQSTMTAPNMTIDDFTVGLWLDTCVEHKDCKTGEQGHLIRILRPNDATLPEFWYGGPGMFCFNDYTCETCAFCQDDQVDSFDGKCPQDVCPGSGNMPECLSAETLMEDWKCPERYKFEVRKYFTDTPSVAYPPQVKNRFLTPFNRLVGSVLVSHKRRDKTSCIAGVGSATPGVRKPSVIQYINNSASASTCLGEEAATEPYGVDSVLIPTSTIYDGKAFFGQAYVSHERADLNGVDAGYGFFNHSYDTMLKKPKDQILINSGFAKSFNMYLDSRATHSQASNYIAYMREGGLIDEQTESIKVQFVTFNIDNNIFTHLEFDFFWEKGGAITWDWTMRTVPGPPVYRWGGEGSTSPLQQPLEVLCMIILAINCMLEFRDVVTSFRIMRPQNYFFNFWNWIDITHLCFMWSGWILWVSYGQRAWDFEMKPDYPGNTDPAADTRYFQTNSTHEFEFLSFLDEVSGLSEDLRTYNEIVAVSVLLFVVRVIKNLDFQERMGLVSRTIIASIPPICHFMVLFFLVFYGYAVVGHILFGHLFAPCATMEDSMMFLFLDMLIGYDPANFVIGMSGATESWAYLIYLYSFLLILFFILFNVLLGILIDTYCEMKGELDEDAPSFIPEMTNILTSNVLDLVIDHKKRMPDAKLKEVLDEHKAGLPSMDSLREALDKSTAEPPSIILNGGAEIDGPTMRKIVTRHSEDKMQRNAISLQAFAGHESDDDDVEEEELEEEWVKMPDGTLKKRTKVVDKKEYADSDEEEMILNIVDRYAHESQVEDGKKDDDELLLLQVEHMKRELAMFRAAQTTHKRVKDMEDQLDRMALAVLPPEERLPKPAAFGGRHKDLGLHRQIRGLLRITLVGARGLPAMDILGSTDPYALVFLTEPLGESVTGAITFRTETKMKTREPTWNADFELPIFPHASSLCVALFDHDSITSDDMIGVAHVHLCDLENWVQQDKWFQLSNSKMSARRTAEAEVHLKITRLPDAAEFMAQQDAARILPSLQDISEEGADSDHMVPA